MGMDDDVRYFSGNFGTYRVTTTGEGNSETFKFEMREDQWECDESSDEFTVCGRQELMCLYEVMRLVVEGQSKSWERDPFKVPSEWQ
jgi:hypothetical protein